MSKEKPWIKITRPWGIGDSLMATSVCRALQRHGYCVEFHAFTKSCSLLEGAACIDRLVETNGTQSDCDIFLKYPTKQGFPHQAMSRHITSYWMEQVGLSPDESREYELPIDDKDRDVARKLTSHLGSYVTVHPYPGYSVNREWPHHYWEQLIQALEHHFPVVVLGGPDDKPLDSGTSLVGKTTLKQDASIIDEAMLHICIDSWTQHAAWALGKRAVVLFGPTNPAFFGYPEHRNITLNVECSPCYREMQDICDHRMCLRDLQVETVFAAVTKELR